MLALVDEEEREKGGNPAGHEDFSELLMVAGRAKACEKKVEAYEKAAKDVRFEIFGDSLFKSLKGIKDKRFVLPSLLLFYEKEKRAIVYFVLLCLLVCIF